MQPHGLILDRQKYTVFNKRFLNCLIYLINPRAILLINRIKSVLISNYYTQVHVFASTQTAM